MCSKHVGVLILKDGEGDLIQSMIKATANRQAMQSPQGCDWRDWEQHRSLCMSLLVSILFFLLVLGKYRLGLRLGIRLQMGAKLLLCCIPMPQDGRANVLLGWIFEETLQRQDIKQV